MVDAGVMFDRGPRGLFAWQAVQCRGMRPPADSLRHSFPFSHPGTLRRLLWRVQRLFGRRTDAFPAANFEEYGGTFALKDGTSIRIRLLRPEDAPLLAEMYNGLSDESFYQRFLSMTKPIPQAMLPRLCQIDYFNSMALVALADDSGHELIVGEGRYAREGGSDFADVAFAVAQDYQGRGIGWILMRQLVEVARRQGLAGFTAEILSANSVMIHMFHKLGLDLESSQRSGICAMRVFLSKPVPTRGIRTWFHRLLVRKTAPKPLHPPPPRPNIWND
jgi:GNAT superfamily N-acetyltransferase